MTSLTKPILAFFLLLFGIGTSPLFSQVNASLQARDTVDLSILRVFPDSFPDVAVFFKAETRSGRPLWRLPQEKVAVMEDGEEREIISLRPVSDYTPIQIALVVDHSGSMLDEFIYSFDTVGGQLVLKNIAIRKKGEPMAIDRAKEGVGNFVKSLRNDRDSFLVVGFSDLVDPVAPMTNDAEKILKIVQKMEATGSTAFYDALRTGIDSLEHYHGLRAVVALTDGMDNASYSSLDSVIRRSQQSKIPIYVIGLGNVDKASLRRLAESTEGDFFYTDQANSLSEIYLRISNRLQAIYELVYRSASLSSSAERQREIQIVFDIDSVYFGKPLETLDLPATAITAMKEREDNLRLILAGAMVLLAMTAIGFLLLRRRKKDEDEPSVQIPPVLENLPTPRAFPNPSTGHVYIKTELPDGMLSAGLSIANLSGQVLRSYTVSGPQSMLELDLTDLPGGTYVYRLSGSGVVSKAGKLVIRK